LASLMVISGMIAWSGLRMDLCNGFAEVGEGSLAFKESEYRFEIAAEQLTLVVTYDNHPFREGLVSSWGFSCLLTGAEKTILFDTGGSGPILLTNMTGLDVDPGGIDVVVLSHIHGDHVGGLEAVLKRNKRVVIYLPQSFPQSFKEDLRRSEVKVVEVMGPIMICPGVYSTGQLGSGLKEQALVIQTDRGIVVITGCAHPGIVRVVETAKDRSGGDVLLTMGGFHLAGKEREEINGIIHDFRQLDVRYVGPCHCSGDLTRKIFQEAYGDHYIEVGVGAVIKFR
jgi:7,8-dihydropterin-6-yl-methyl-4-(beta-D-ribofuranosyl)aminobenzene 5'-phosphate synthase